VSAAFGGFGGSLNFGCDEEYDCSAEHGDRAAEVIVGSARNYREWLETKPGKDDYSFWNIQERVLAGFDFNPGPIIVGLAGGLQMFQGGGDYDDMRDELDSQYIVDDVDGSSGMGFVMAYWLGFRFGPNGGGCPTECGQAIPGIKSVRGASAAKAILFGRTLSFSGVKAGTAEVLNLQGQVVAKGDVSSTLSLASLDAGVYMVRVAGKVSFSNKIVLK
jgi:hypothetical protein